MILAQQTRGKYTVTLEADKESKYYLNEIGEIRQSPLDILQYLGSLENAKVKEKIHVYKFTAITEQERNRRVKSGYDWVNSQFAPAQPSVSAFITMMSNKGYR